MTLVKVRMLKKWRSKEVGDIINISKKGAEAMIEAGAGEYVEASKPKKKLSPEEKKEWAEAYREAEELAGIKKDEPQTKEGKEITTKLLDLVYIRDSIDLEIKLKEIKKETGISVKTLRIKLNEIREKIAKEREEEENENVECELDERFTQEDLLVKIWEELNKDHVYDNREKIGAFLIAISGFLPNPKDHTSGAFKGNSSAGKDNMQLTALKHIPKEHWARATRITQSEIEDRIKTWKILAISEINKHRDGANTDIVETFKQVIEDGISIYKKDNITGESKELNIEQKTGFYGTTETETDEELETRYVIIPVRGSIPKNRAVVKSSLERVADINSIVGDLKNKESWISKSIRSLNPELDVVIPYATELFNRIPTELGDMELFDYSKERVKRDVKRLLSLTKAISWLFQNRRIKQKIGEKEVIVSEPTDFITALKIFLPFFNVSYSGLDPRIERTLTKIKELQGKHATEIGNNLGFGTDKESWVIRSELQKELGIESVNTIKAYIDQLKDKGLIETYWTQDHPKLYLIHPIKEGVKSLSDPIIIKALIGYLQGIDRLNNRYKELGKEELDDLKLPECLDIDDKKEKEEKNNVTISEKLTGVNLTGSNLENMPKKNISEDIDFNEMEVDFDE